MNAEVTGAPLVSLPVSGAPADLVESGAEWKFLDGGIAPRTNGGLSSLTIRPGGLGGLNSALEMATK